MKVIPHRHPKQSSFLFDNTDEHYYSFTLDNIAFRSFKYFEDLKSGHPEYFNAIRTVINTEHEPKFDSYKSSVTKLELKFAIVDDKIYIISCGEKQPGRYQIYLEGVFAISE